MNARRYLIVVVGLAGFLWWTAASAQPALPDTPAGHYLSDFLAMYNRADPSLAEQFAEARLHPDLLKELGGVEGAMTALARLYLSVGPLELVALREQSPRALAAFAQGAFTKEWVAIEVETDPDDPDRITMQGVDVGNAPPGVGPIGPMSEQSFRRALGDYLDELARHDYFSGVVLVAKDGVPIFQGAYGKRNDAGDPVTLDSKFGLASLSKMFTAVAVGQLVEARRLSFDDPASRYLPDNLAERIRGVSVHHLLSHTSGLGGFDFAEIKNKRTVQDMLAVAVAPTPFTPGERFYYSNMGYVLLGAVIERASGEDYYDYIHAHILEPLGMADSGALPLDESTPGYATGFIPDVEAWLASGSRERKSNRDDRVTRGSPAGDFLSTASDLLRFSEGLRDSSLVSADLLDLMTAPKAADAHYGYGFQTFPSGMVGHTGGARGENTHFAMQLTTGDLTTGDLTTGDLTTGYTVIVLANYDQAAALVARYIDSLLGLQ